MLSLEDACGRVQVKARRVRRWENEQRAADDARVSLLLGLLGEARAEIEQLGSRVASERSRWAGEIERLADARAADVGVMTSLRESLALENRTSAEMREQLSVSLNECSDARASLETSESERGEIRAALNSRDLALAETTQYVTRLESERVQSDALSQRLVEMDAALGARSDELEASTNRIALLEATKDELEQAIELERRAMEAEASLKDMAIKQSQARAEAEAAANAARAEAEAEARAEAAADAARAEAKAKARAEVQAAAEAARAEADAKARAEVQAAAEAARAEAEAKARADVQAAAEAARAEAEAKAHAEAEAAAERIRVLELDSATLTRQRDEAMSRVEDMASETDALLSAQSEANARAVQDMERLRCSLSSSESALADEKERLRAAEATAHCAAAAFDVERAAARKQQLEAAAEFDAAAERECSAAEREDGLRASQEVAMMTITDFEERRRQAEAEIAQQISARESAETEVAVIRSELETKLLVIATLETERDAASAAAESARETLRDVENNMRAGQFSEDDLDLDVDIDLEDGDGEVDEKTGKREETAVTQSCSAESELVLRLCAERDEARAERDAAHFAGKQWRDMLDEMGRDDDFHHPLSSCSSAPAPTAVSAEQDGAAVSVPSASPGRESMDQLRVALSAMEKQRHEYEELLALQSEMLEHHDEALLLVEQHGALDLDRGKMARWRGGGGGCYDMECVRVQVGATAGASQLPHPRDIVGSGEIAPSPPISVHKPPSSESEADFFTTFGV